MNLVLFKRLYKCEVCKRSFEVFALPPEGIYGEFVLYAQNGELAYWDALTDPTFDEVGNKTKQLPALQLKSDINKSSAYLAICGICCDPAKDGSVFQLQPVCPNCKSNQTTFIREPEPPESATLDIPHVTHKRWRQLSTQEQLQALVLELEKKNLL